jgi:hypothetical protein
MEQAVNTEGGSVVTGGSSSFNRAEFEAEHTKLPRDSGWSEAKFFITLGAVSFIFTILLLRKLIPDY